MKSGADFPATGGADTRAERAGPALYGPETVKAIANFGRGRTPRILIAAYAKVKRAAVEAVQDSEHRFDPALFACLVDALDEIASGGLDLQFPLPLRQGGAGTSLNMNLNEVAASRARELFAEREGRAAPPLDPIEDVNRFQSTNDTFPTAVSVVAYELVTRLETRIVAVQEQLVAKEKEYEGLLIAGRTELQDALPVRLGQVFGAWAGCLERDRWRFNKLKERIRTSALGGTAIGTCFSATVAYVHAAERRLRAATGLPFARSQNLPDEIAHQDKLAEAAQGIGLCAGNLKKICADLLLYTSSLSREMVHPELQYGSTIMPAKSNPVLLEYIRGQAIAAEHEAQCARDFAFEGQLQLNPYLPFLADALIAAAGSLEAALAAMSERLLPILQPDRTHIVEGLLRSNVLLNLLVPVLGYRRVKELAEQLRTELAEPGPGMAQPGPGEPIPTGADGLEAYVDRVARLSGRPRGEIAARFDPYAATGFSAEGDLQ
ncbi:MAG TPA: lyase family protein [Rectinemataceae bacterium]|nr:lyase family protein [Rectinemataceae bacterium]